MAGLAELAGQLRDALNLDLAAGQVPASWRALQQTCGPTAGDRPGHEDLADLAAQTLAYGLFTAAWYHAGPTPFTLRAAGRTLSQANPFVKELFRGLNGELPARAACRKPIAAIMKLLGNLGQAPLPADFGRSEHHREPASDLYEEFLRAYDPKTRGACGVYCTPQPVVGYMVRSVDYLLKERLGQRAGLAEPGVSILDPAFGTGAFLCGAVDHVRAEFFEQEDADSWPAYAGKQLTPRLIGLEKLPAPHAVANVMLRLHLAGRKEKPAGYGRLNLHLADALKDPKLWPSVRLITAGSAGKPPSPIVVLGNPPYSGISENRSPWIDDLLRGKLPDGSAGASYYHVDDQPLRERKVWLQDDYVKFLRLGQWLIEQADAGILAFVTNHAWLDNPTFRGLRRSLMQTFTDIYVLDLHGNAKKKETCPDGSPDENVFDIQQGVAIGLFVKEGARSGEARVRHAELWGSRAEKFKRLARTQVGRMRFKRLRPRPPYYFFVVRDEKLRAEYERGWKITEIMPVHTTGIVTARDHFVTDLDQAGLLKRMAEFRDPRISDATIREKYFAGKGSPKYAPGDSRGWKLPEARRRVRADRRWREHIVPCLYRPFDVRPLYYVPWMVDWPRPEVMRHMLAGANLALITVRQVAEGTFNHAFVTDTIADGRVTLSNKGIAYVFPLYLYPPTDAGQPGAMGKLCLPVQNTATANINAESAPGAMGKLCLPVPNIAAPNISAEFTQAVAAKLRLRKPPRALDLFHYIYAVLHSPAYRQRYAAFLQSDFPRIPLPADRASFRKLARLGRELCSLHLLQRPLLDRTTVQFPVPGSNLIAPGHPRYVAPGQPDPHDPQHRLLKKGRVYINKPDPKRGTPAQYFEGISPETWNYQLCGYQPCRKWLADRRRRTLTPADLTHYRRLATTIQQTYCLVERIVRTEEHQPECSPPPKQEQ